MELVYKIIFVPGVRGQEGILKARIPPWVGGWGGSGTVV